MISCSLAGIHRINRGWNSRRSAAIAGSECQTLVVRERKRNYSLQAVSGGGCDTALLCFKATISHDEQSSPTAVWRWQLF